ncbi:PREDICTED: interferon lambda-4-like [Cercocebus atys]|uniref:interferon lambda-4-like n=1 Tax=Cercocebus atys TaxID=9531 RepID=UPI0005F5205B|nr:PREDICTED: interferon lambda-4-like [Cercocebus atys]
MDHRGTVAQVETALDASQGTVDGSTCRSTRHRGCTAGRREGRGQTEEAAGSRSLSPPEQRCGLEQRAESVWAAVAAGLWVLCTVGAATPPSPRCLLSRYRSLEPWTLAAVKGLRVCYEEEALSWGPRTCSFRPWRDPPRPSLELARPGSSRKVPGAPRRRHKPRRADSPRCREVSVVFNLLRLLTWELMQAGSWGTCL